MRRICKIALFCGKINEKHRRRCMLGIIAAMQKEADVLLLQSKDVQCAEKFGKKVYRAEFGGIPLSLGAIGDRKGQCRGGGDACPDGGSRHLLNLGVAGGRAGLDARGNGVAGRTRRGA